MRVARNVERVAAGGTSGLGARGVRGCARAAIPRRSARGRAPRQRPPRQRNGQCNCTCNDARTHYAPAHLPAHTHPQIYAKPNRRARTSTTASVASYDNGQITVRSKSERPQRRRTHVEVSSRSVSLSTAAPPPSRCGLCAGRSRIWDCGGKSAS